MVKLPKRISGVLDDLIKDLQSRESISSVGLFGSWSRGDAVLSSDVDLLIIDKRDFDYEYIERLELDNILIDLDYIPEKWILKGVPPEVDQKLYEAQILFDRNWTLTNTKEWMSKTYWSPERVDIRTENYLIESDTYLSRAVSAWNKGDLKSAVVYSWVGLEPVMKIIIEICMLPVSNSHFIEASEEASRELGLSDILNKYLDIASLSNIRTEDAKLRIHVAERAWKEIIMRIDRNTSVLDTLHIKIRNALRYYGKMSFLRGLMLRAKSLIDSGLYVEAAHYVARPFLDLIENYMWLVSGIEGFRFDYTQLVSSLKGRGTEPSTIYELGTKVLGVEKDLSESEVKSIVTEAREIALEIRRQRKRMILENIKTSTD